MPGASVYHDLVTKWYWATSKISTCLRLENGNLILYWGYGSGTSNEAWTILTSIAAGETYHIGLTLDGIAKTCVVRVYIKSTDTATTYNHTFTNELRICDANFYVAAEQAGQNHADGRMDELVIFKDLLTEGEMDQIRQGQYQSAKYAVLREVPPVDGDYIQVNAADQVELLALENMSGSIESVKGVMVCGRFLGAGNPTPKQVKVGLRTNASNYWSDAKPVELNMACGLQRFWGINPNTGVAWTVDDINNLEAGIQSIT